MAIRQSTTNVARPTPVVDWNAADRGPGSQVLWSAVGEQYRRTPGGIVTLTAGAAQAATSLTVAALPIALRVGQVLRFSADEFATVATAAAKGATTVTVEALVNALENGDAATVAGVGDKHIPAFTAMARYTTGPNLGKIIPRGSGASAPTDTETYGILISNADEFLPSDSLSGYGVYRRASVYEALLPEAVNGALPANIKTGLAALGFQFERYSDNTAA